MLTKTEALELVATMLRQMSTPDDPFVVVDEETIETTYGWVFFFDSKKHLETGDHRYALAGNVPIMVNKHDATVEFFALYKSLSESIAEYESKQAERQKS
jgi:immunity protein 35 of polymorphic toxin system